MQLLEKCSLHMELPSVLHEPCFYARNESLEYLSYQNVRKLYDISSRPRDESNGSTKPMFNLVNKLVENRNSVDLEYILVCYDSYPLMDKLYPPLFVRNSLQAKKSLAFSFSNQGGLSPITAIHYGNIQKKNLLLVCMEQLWDYEEPKAERITRSDALSVVHLHPTMGSLEILYYGIMLNESSSISIRSIFSAIEKIMLKAGISTDSLTIIPRSFSDHYTEAIRRKYPDVYMHQDQKDYSTADLFYSLSDYMKYSKKRKPYILLVFLDDIGTGCLIMRDNEYFSMEMS